MRLLYLLGLTPLATATLIDTQFPHLLVPISTFSPDTPLGTLPTGEVSNNICTLASFDIAGLNGTHSCRINFHINKSPAKNAPREVAGEVPYTFEIRTIKAPGAINKDLDTWNHHPEPGEWVATVRIDEKWGVRVEGGWTECRKWAVNQFVVKPRGDRKVRVWWFELDYPWDQGGPHGLTLEMHKWD